MAKWEELPMADKTQYMRIAVKNGFRDIRTIREAYNEYASGGEMQVKEEHSLGGPEESKIDIGGNLLAGFPLMTHSGQSLSGYPANKFYNGGDKDKTGPTYNAETKKWTNAKGQDITEKSFKKKDGSTTTYLASGAVMTESMDKKEPSYTYAPGIKRVYIGGDINEARQKYFDTDTEFTDSIKSIAKRYGIKPNVLASRVAKEGPVDAAIRHYNGTNGYFKRGDMKGPAWGLDDLGYMINKGLIAWPKNREIDTDFLFENEKGRTTRSVYSEHYFDGMELTAAALQRFRREMKKKFPKATEAQLDQYAAAAFNMGMTGATNAIRSGKLKDSYRPFINIKAYGG